MGNKLLFLLESLGGMLYDTSSMKIIRKQVTGGNNLNAVHQKTGNAERYAEGSGKCRM